MPSIKALVAVSSAVISLANAHMIMVTPHPYGKPNNSPLDAAGADFPCKGLSNSVDGAVQEMAVGSQQQLSFMGSAVHGGGSCQVSLTTDSPPTKKSTWMVIYSILGGCPAKHATGNLPENPDSTGSDKYPFSIPQGVKPGAYTLAWTWFNHIGNREMYMNCANVKITGGSSKRDVGMNETMAGVPDLAERDTSSFPNMFVANIPSSNCEVPDSVDVLFPSPGPNVAKFGDPSTLKAPTGSMCNQGPAAAGQAGGSTGTSSAAAGGAGAGSGAGAGAGAGSGAGSGASSGASSGAGSGGSSGGSSGAGSGAGSGASSGSGASGSTDGSASAQSPAAAQPSAAASPASASTTAVAAASSPSTASSSPISNSSTGSAPSSGSPSTSTSCTAPGQAICSPDGKQVGECDASLHVVMTPVPEGTVCKQGMVTWPRKRAFGHSRRQLSIPKWSF